MRVCCKLRPYIKLKSTISFLDLFLEFTIHWQRICLFINVKFKELMENKSLIGKELREMLAKIERGEHSEIDKPKLKPMKKDKIGASLREFLAQIDNANEGSKKD